MKTKDALEEFIDTIEATGGVTEDESGLFYVPVADLEWLDLAEAYIAACKEKGKKPKLV